MSHTWSNPKIIYLRAHQNKQKMEQVSVLPEELIESFEAKLKLYLVSVYPNLVLLLDSKWLLGGWASNGPSIPDGPLLNYFIRIMKSEQKFYRTHLPTGTTLVAHCCSKGMNVLGYELAWNILSFNVTEHFIVTKKYLKTNGNHNKRAEALIVCSLNYVLHIQYYSNGWVHNDFFKKYFFSRK